MITKRMMDFCPKCRRDTLHEEVSDIFDYSLLCTVCNIVWDCVRGGKNENPTKTRQWTRKN